MQKLIPTYIKSNKNNNSFPVKFLFRSYVRNAIMKKNPQNCKSFQKILDGSEPLRVRILVVFIVAGQ